MTIEEQALELADALDQAGTSGGFYLDEANAELVAKALRWFALIAGSVTQRANPLMNVGTDTLAGEAEAAGGYH